MLLQLDDVSKSFGGVAALTGVTFQVNQGKSLVLLDLMVLVKLRYST